MRKGEQNSNASLMDYEIEEIKAMHEAGISMNQIAKIYCVSQPYISMLINEKRRVHKDT